MNKTEVDKLIEEINKLIRKTKGLQYAQLIGLLELIKSDYIEEMREDE